MLYTALEDVLEQTRSYSNEKVPQFLSYLKPMEAGHAFDFSEEGDDRNYNTGKPLVIEQYFNPYSYREEKRRPHKPLELPEMPRIEDQEGQEDEHMTKEMMNHLGFEVTNLLEVNEGKLYQMDMLIPKEQMEHVMRDLETNGTEGKKAIKDTQYHWTDGPEGYPLVPYTFADTKVNRDTCLKAMDEWTTHTCVKFETKQGSAAEPHLKFFQGNGCFSYIGRIWFFNGQYISIGKNCGLSSAVHEVGHALGLFHEQSRPDRDEEVRVNTNNILQSSRFNFDEAKLNSINNYGVKYDLTSIMHYRAKTFYNGGLTLSTVNPLLQELVGSMDKLSHRDKLLVNRMYNCIDKWVKACGKSADPCKNDGYLGVNCTCICPPGTCGDYCQYQIEGYYDAYLSGCSENITVASTIQSEDFPNPIPPGVKCTKWIIAPECHQVELTFTNFAMYPRIQCQNNQLCCYWDGLEIRTNDPYVGTWYCANEIHQGRKFIHSGSIILYYHTTSRYSRGWEAQVRFLPIAGCRTQGKAGTEKPVLPEELTRTVFSGMTIFSLNTAVNKLLPPKGDSKCGLLEDLGNVYWNSPLFGFEKYPQNSSCFFTLVPNSPVAVKVKFDYFKLQPRASGVCVDSVDLVEPFSQETRLCGSQTSKILLPSSAFTARFASDKYYNYQGFNITFEPQSNSACHKIINTAAGEAGMITTPNFPSFHGRECVCEWWIIAPANKKIKISVEGKKIGRCSENYLVVDLQGSRSYYRPISTRVCGEKNLPISLLSSGNELNVVYKSMRNSKGFHIRYEVV
ncbi:zinc metalloproteinase dpy-31 [Penaeus vannamei]|uniref:zinc metalloproteinase dpy-31 n=1 Tax=Penaeus vannamei TaxID=6689 RepID=UPI00387F556E